MSYPQPKIQLDLTTPQTVTLLAPLFKDNVDNQDIVLPDPAKPARSVAFKIVDRETETPQDYFNYKVIENTQVKEIKVEFSGLKQVKLETFSVIACYSYASYQNL